MGRWLRRRRSSRGRRKRWVISALGVLVKSQKEVGLMERGDQVRGSGGNVSTTEGEGEGVEFTMMGANRRWRTGSSDGDGEILLT